MLIAQRRLLEVLWLDLARLIMAGAQLFDALAVDVETDHRGARAGESDRDRQADIAEADHSDFAFVWQKPPLESLVAAILYPLDQGGGNRQCVAFARPPIAESPALTRRQS